MTSPELIAYIRKQKELGIPETDYKAALSSQGWKIEDINEALAALSEGVPRPPQNAGSSDHTLKAKIITGTQILFSIPLLMWIVTEFLWDSKWGSVLFYSNPDRTLSPTWAIAAALNDHRGTLAILLLVLIALVIAGFIINHILKKQTGRKAIYLTVINLLSLVVIFAWVYLLIQKVFFLL